MNIEEERPHGRQCWDSVGGVWISPVVKANQIKVLPCVNITFLANGCVSPFLFTGCADVLCESTVPAVYSAGDQIISVDNAHCCAKSLYASDAQIPIRRGRVGSSRMHCAAQQ